MSRRIAVVLFNLGGPDTLKAVRPFLFNLFNDVAIISLPQPFRWILAQLIAYRRAPIAEEIYRQIGGRSPLLEETEAQRLALDGVLQTRFPDDTIQVFIAMRHWRPFTRDAARAVERYRPDDIILLPLYPQFSTTTTGSSLGEWRKHYRGGGETHTACCYPDQAGFVQAHIHKIDEAYQSAGGNAALRVIFSAHGLPEKVIADGDPYQAQVETTVGAIVQGLNLSDWRICYQSRVGPLKWIGPSISEVILEAGGDGVGVLVVPVVFVSEHSETLVELDIEYREMAASVGVPVYLRAKAICVDPSYISALSDMVVSMIDAKGVSPCGTGCRGPFSKCPYQEQARAA